VGDSHIRGIAERISFKLGSSFRTIGYVKQNASLNHITLSVKSELKNLSKSDVVVLCGGTLDVARNDTMKGLSSVSQFVKNNEHTNVIVVDTLHRFDLTTYSRVNKEVIALNRKLKKIIKPYNHNSKLNLNVEREHFTQHGLHTNGSGKDRISGLLASRIMKLVTTRPLGTPLAIPWKVESSEKEKNQMRPIIKEFTVTSAELQINKEQQTHSNNVQQESERVPNVVFDSVNDTEPSTLGKMFEKIVIVCEDSDMEAPTATPSSDEEP
jgi:hypothetical protein